LPGGCDEAEEDGEELGEDEAEDDGCVDGELLDDGDAELLELPPGPQGPLSVQTPCELLPGMSPWVHHFAVQLWPPYETTAPPL
jgi:hypothetical protein